MKTLILFLGSVLFYLQANAQTASSCSPSPMLTDKYPDDVADMAIGRMYSIKSPDTMFMIPPQKYLDTILNGLAAINNLTGKNASIDSIFNKYCLHNSYYRNAKTIINVSLDRGKSWTDKWAAKITTSGYGALDSFVVRAGGEVKYYYESAASGAWATLYLGKVVNGRAFADSLKHFTGIFDAVPGAYIGDGHSISYAVDTVQRFTFTLGWGDCPAGCTGKRSWTYSVDKSCAVTLTKYQYITDPSGEPGMPNCFLFPTSIEDIFKERDNPVTLFPNPTNELLHLKTSVPVDYSIFNMEGRIMMTGKLQAKSTLHISGWPSGIYTIQCYSTEGRLMSKSFSKQ